MKVRQALGGPICSIRQSNAASITPNCIKPLPSRSILSCPGPAG
jgi:hypothetical protein